VVDEAVNPTRRVVSLISRPCQHDVGYTDGRSQI